VDALFAPLVESEAIMRAVAMVLISWAAFAQTQEPEFEAASIKPSGPIEQGRFVGWKGGPGTNDPGVYTYTFCTVELLIMRAYDVPYYRLSNTNRLPDTRFHVIAAVPTGTTKEQFLKMQQNLLADRFKLATHRETHETDTLRLLTAEGGIKLKAYVEGEPPMKRDMREPGIYYQEQGRTLAEFADFVAGYYAKPVINATGLDGKYDFNVWFSVGPDNSLAPSIGTAIRALGLRVESHKESLEMIVVDHVEKTPTEN